jgi:hypothetical protein
MGEGKGVMWGEQEGTGGGRGRRRTIGKGIMRGGIDGGGGGDVRERGGGNSKEGRGVREEQAGEKVL